MLQLCDITITITITQYYALKGNVVTHTWGVGWGLPHFTKDKVYHQTPP